MLYSKEVTKQSSVCKMLYNYALVQKSELIKTYFVVVTHSSHLILEMCIPEFNSKIDYKSTTFNATN